jgi:hypothetical protein
MIRGIHMEVAMQLFYEDEYEALQLMISGSDKTHKEVATYLFPHMKAESAYARLKACLNAERVSG